MSNQPNSSPFKLYSYWRSSASWRVRIALELKHIPYEIIPINLVKGEQKQEEYLKINPMGLLPALLFPDGKVLIESVAILELLEEIYPDAHPLLPKDPYERAQVRAIVNLIACDIHPVQNLKVLKKVGDAGKAEWAKSFITDGYQALEQLLQRSAGKYCFGDEITLADICLVPQTYNACRWGVDMSQFPLIDGIVQRLSGLDCFQKAHPSSQPDKVE